MLKKSIYIIYMVGFMDMVAVGVFIPLFPQHARRIGISPLNIGLFSSIYGILQFFSSARVGSWSDRSGKVNVLVQCLLLSALGYYILGFTNTIAFIFLSRIIAGCFKHTQTLAKAYLTDIISETERHQVYGIQSSISNLGFIVGPLIGAFISEFENGFHISATICATLFVFQSIVVRVIFDTDLRNLKGEERARKEVKPSDWREIASKPYLRAIFIVQLLMSASSLLYRENASLLLHIKFQQSARNIGFMISFANFVSSVSGFFVARLAKFYRDDDVRLLLHCVFAHIFAVLAATFAPAFWVYNLCLVPYKLSQAVARIAILNMMVLNADGIASGELIGASQSLFAISRILASFVCGLLQESSVLLPGCLACVLAVMVIPIVRSMRVKTD